MRDESYGVLRPYGRDEHFKLAVAEWLEFEANAIDFDVRVGLTEREATSGAGRPALAVARAYLGSNS